MVPSPAVLSLRFLKNMAFVSFCYRRFGRVRHPHQWFLLAKVSIYQTVKRSTGTKVFGHNMAVALDERDVLDLVIAFLDERGFHGGHHDFYPSSKLNR
jgi:hypothetical protein